MYNGRWLTKSALAILLLSIYRVSSINYYLVCSFPIHKYALCEVYLARFLCFWQRKTPKTLKCRFWMSQGHWKYISILIPLLRLTPPTDGFPGTIYVKFCKEVRRWLRYRAVKTYCRELGRTNVKDRQTTDR